MKCKNCGNETKFIPNYIHEDIELNIDRTDDVHLCSMCGALYYRENGYNVLEYTPFILELSKTIKGFATDYDVAISKMKQHEEVQVD